jgi:hypothetical protein
LNVSSSLHLISGAYNSVKVLHRLAGKQHR